MARHARGRAGSCCAERRSIPAGPARPIPDAETTLRTPGKPTRQACRRRSRARYWSPGSRRRSRSQRALSLNDDDFQPRARTDRVERLVDPIQWKAMGHDRGQLVATALEVIHRDPVLPVGGAVGAEDRQLLVEGLVA